VHVGSITFGMDELRASASARWAPASLLPLRKGSSAAVAIESVQSALLRRRSSHRSRRPWSNESAGGTRALPTDWIADRARYSPATSSASASASAAAETAA
jgi:hypothetical protein